MLAHSWEGKPLTRDHGAPVRVIIPKWYLWKSAKWLKGIEFSAQDKLGFWERAYVGLGKLVHWVLARPWYEPTRTRG